jgi:hypothetical protein
MDDNVMEFSPSQPIDVTKRVIVCSVHPEWLEYYPEIKSVVLQHPEWEGRSFVIEPPMEGLSRKHLKNMLTWGDGRNTFYPVEMTEAGLVAVVLHQQGYVEYASLYTYRRKK